MPFNNDDYVDVAERIQQFYAKYPDGRLATTLVKFCQWPKDGIFAQAEAARTADDPKPGVGSAWEPVPGPTNFTRDSEVQNAETAAWGRAIAAVGIKTKKIASADEVRNRKAAEETERAAKQRGTTDLKLPPEKQGVITDAQRRKLFATGKGYGLADDEIKAIVKQIAGVDSTKDIPRYKVDAVLKEIEVQGLGMPS